MPPMLPFEEPIRTNLGCEEAFFEKGIEPLERAVEGLFLREYVK